MTHQSAEMEYMSRIRKMATRILGEFGYETVCFQTLQRGMKLWFSKRRLAMVGYVDTGRYWITAGSPIGNHQDLTEIATEFELAAHAHEHRVCYVCAERNGMNQLTAAGRGTMVIGAIPIWNPIHWPQIIAGNARLRYQIARAKRKCDGIIEITPSHAARTPAIRRLIGDWLSQRWLMPMRFLADPFILSDAAAPRRIFTVHIHTGQLAGLLAASPIPARNGMFIEQIVRLPHAPNGIVELMIDHAMRNFAAYRHVTLGLVAGSRFASDHENPWWARAARYSVRRWGQRLYRFESLENFRATLQPEAWEPVYAVSDRPRIVMRDILAACRAMFRFPFLRFKRIEDIVDQCWSERPVGSDFFHNH